jgi:chromosome segregation ATPase
MSIEETVKEARTHCDALREGFIKTNNYGMLYTQGLIFRLCNLAEETRAEFNQELHQLEAVRDHLASELNTAHARINDLEKELATQKERADYAWKATEIIDKDRAKLLAERDEYKAGVTAAHAEQNRLTEEVAKLSRAQWERDQMPALCTQLAEQRDALAATVEYLRDRVGEYGRILDVEEPSTAAILAARDARVRAEERERCAKVCDFMAGVTDTYAADDCSVAIRAIDKDLNHGQP